MSIGNLKDSGNQGNNLPFQWKVLQGIQSIISQNDACCQDILNSLGEIGSFVKPVLVIPNIQVLSGVIGFLPDKVYSISFANVGTVPISLSFDGGITTVTIPVGVTINMDAGGLTNTYPPNTFAWDTDFVGASLIITYNTPTP
jgi:hypothetical protein